MVETIHIINQYMFYCIYFHLYVVICCTFSPFPTHPFCHALLITNSYNIDSAPLRHFFLIK